MSFDDLKNIVEQYFSKNNINFDSQMETMVIMNLQSRVNKLDVIQVDETFIRESQKDSKELVVI